MSGRGRKAVLPPADFQAAERLAPNGLQVTVINKDGYGRVFDFAKMPVPEPMRRSLARLYADQSLAWHSHASGLAYWQSLLVFARFLQVQGQPAQDLEDLTAATLKLWRNNHKDTPGGREAMAKMRTLLNQDPRLARGPAAEELARPVPNKGKTSGKSSYKPSERAAVLLAAERCFRPALLRIRENTALLGRFRAGELTEGTAEWQIGQLLQHIATTGDIPRLTHGKIPGSSRVLLGGTTRVYTWGRLFLTRRELTSLAVLMTDRFGWNHSTYNRLPVPVTTASLGEATTVTYTVTIEKRRRGAGRWFDTENHTDSGADSPGRLITLALEATQHARALGAVIAPSTDLLMVARLHQTGQVDADLDQPRPVWPLAFGVTKADARRWATSHGVGSPFRRSRRTAVVREGKPLQHSRGTHESVYVLTWSIRMVDDFADDILAAFAERRRMHAIATATKSSAEGRAALLGYVTALIDAGSPLPATVHRGRGLTLANHYVAYVTGASQSQVCQVVSRLGLKEVASRNPGPAPMQIPVTGRLEGRPWREHMDYEETLTLVRHLVTAAAIVITYLTGMRSQESRTLRSGCCPDPEPTPDGTTPRHLIRAHHYKNVRDSDGHHVSAGEERDVPWVAITPVVNAIRVLERIVPEGELLFSASHHDIVNQRTQHGALKRTSIDSRVEQFIAWINREAIAQGLPDQIVPNDPHGGIGLSRLRRTLAWHIARRPGGLIALAIQYGHMRTVLDARTSSGYGGRERRGIHAELDVETALAAADTAARLRDAIAAGEKVSGPAARRAIVGAASLPRFEGALTTPKAAAKYLARDGLVLFDNPDAFLICAFKRSTALCEPAPDATAPNQFACQLGCGNAVRTDSHARAAREHADRLDLRANHLPKPLGSRLRRTADAFRALADAHNADIQLSQEALA